MMISTRVCRQLRLSSRRPSACPRDPVTKALAGDVSGSRGQAEGRRLLEARSARLLFFVKCLWIFLLIDTQGHAQQMESDSAVFIRVYGVARAAEHVEIKSEVSAKIYKIYVTSLLNVHAGELLVELKHDDISAELAEQNAKLFYQQKNYQRYLSLVRHHLIPQDFVDKLYSELQQTRAKIKQLSASLDKYYIRAPFSGVISLIRLSIGQYVQPTETILQLTNARTLWVDFSVPLHEIRYPMMNLPVVLTDSTFMKSKFNGKITATNNIVDSKSNTLTVRVAIDNEKCILRSGTFVSGLIQFNTGKVGAIQ